MSRPESGEEEGVPGITGALMLDGWGIKGLLGYMWLHGGILHLLGITCYFFFWFILFCLRRFVVRSCWMILFWLSHVQERMADNGTVREIFVANMAGGRK